MNILMIAGRIPHHPLDGGAMRIYHMAQQWSTHHRLTLVAPQFKPIEPEALAQCAQEMGVELHAVPVQIAPRWRRAAIYVSQALRGGPTIDYYPEVTALLRNLARIHTFDVIELEGSGAGLYLPALADISPRPRTILVLYDVMWNWWKREFISSPRLISLARWLTYRTWEPRLVQQVDCCVFMSDTDATVVTTVVKPKHALIVPNGIEVHSFARSPLPDTPEVLFIGSLTHLPNQQAVKWLVNEIWPALKRRLPTARLTVVGRDPPADLVTLARSAGVTLEGNVPSVRPYYERSRAVVVPIRTGGGIRVKILEALAAARPVVTTQVGAEGLPLVPGEHALFADDPEELAEALTRLLTDRPLAERLAANGRALVEREFNWEALARKQESTFYRE